MLAVTLHFSDDDANALNAALVKRPDFLTIEAFLQAHCQGAVDAGRQDLKALAVEAFERTGTFPTIVEREVEKPTVVLMERVDGVLTPVDPVEAAVAVAKIKDPA